MWKESWVVVERVFLFECVKLGDFVIFDCLLYLIYYSGIVVLILGHGLSVPYFSLLFSLIYNEYSVGISRVPTSDLRIYSWELCDGSTRLHSSSEAWKRQRRDLLQASKYSADIINYISVLIRLLLFFAKVGCHFWPPTFLCWGWQWKAIFLAFFLCLFLFLFLFLLVSQSHGDNFTPQLQLELPRALANALRR